MAQISASYNNCPCLYIQEGISIIEKENKIYSNSQNATFDFIRSNENVSQIPFKIIKNTDGKYANSSEPGAFSVEYYEEECTPPVSTAMDACNPATSGKKHNGRKIEKYWADQFVNFKIEINRDTDDRDKCYSIEDIKRDLFSSLKYQILAQIEQKILTLIAPTIGGYKNQISPINSLTNPKVINMLNPGNGKHYGINLMNMMFKAKKINQKIKYIIESGGQSELFLENKISSVNNNFVGQDINKLMFDAVVSDQLGSTAPFSTDLGENIIGIPYGQYAIVEYNRFAGKYEELLGEGAPGIEKTTMSLWGLNWDVLFKRDTCVDIMEFQYNFGLGHVPKIACNDKLALNFIAGCGDDNCSSIQDCLSA